jgi:hypothetical protein
MPSVSERAYYYFKRGLRSDQIARIFGVRECDAVELIRIGRANAKQKQGRHDQDRIANTPTSGRAEPQQNTEGCSDSDDDPA